MMQHSPSGSPILPTGKSFFNLVGGFRGGRPRSNPSLIDETLSFFVKATGKDEASMRQQLTSEKRQELRRSRDHWKARAEDEERFQYIEEEAWRLFERQPGIKRKTREEFEEDFGRKVRNVMGNSRGEQEKAVQKWSSEMQGAIQPEDRRCVDEKSLQAWVEDLLKIALAQDRKKEARERQNMEQEDSNSQRCRVWEKIWDPRVLA